jgi:hypothetical protein
VSCNVSHRCVSYVMGVYITGVLFLWLPVAVPAMWVVVSAPEMCCLGHNVISLWGWTYSETRSKRVDELKLRHGDAADEERSKPNVEAESKEAVLSLGQQKQAGCQYPPVRTPKAPQKEPGM